MASCFLEEEAGGVRYSKLPCRRSDPKITKFHPVPLESVKVGSNKYGGGTAGGYTKWRCCSKSDSYNRSRSKYGMSDKEFEEEEAAFLEGCTPVVPASDASDADQYQVM